MIAGLHDRRQVARLHLRPGRPALPLAGPALIWSVAERAPEMPSKTPPLSAPEENALAEHVKAQLRDVGDAIAEARRERGWHQEALAQRTGLSRRTIIRTEAGEDVAHSTLVRIAYALDMEPRDRGWSGGLLGRVARAACAHVGLDLCPPPLGLVPDDDDQEDDLSPKG